MMKTMIPPQVGMRLRTLQKKGERPKKEKAKEKKEEKEKKKIKREKKREGTMLLSLFPHLCFK